MLELVTDIKALVVCFRIIKEMKKLKSLEIHRTGYKFFMDNAGVHLTRWKNTKSYQQPY